MPSSQQIRRHPPLRAVRVARGLGLNEVARLAGLDPGHLSRVERGQAHFSVEALTRLARVLGLDELAKLLAPYTNGGDDAAL